MTEPPVFSAEVEPQPVNQTCVVALVGKLDPLAAEELDGRLDAVYQDGFRRVVLDLSRLEYVGSLGLRSLVALANRVRGSGRVVACGASRGVREVFTLTKVSQLIPLYPTRADALDALRT